MLLLARLLRVVLLLKVVLLLGSLLGYRCTSDCALSPSFHLLCPSLAYALISNMSIIIGRSVAVRTKVGGSVKVCIRVYYTSGKPY